MSEDYYTREAFEARLAARRANPVPPDPVAFFYHAALMPGWRPIVAEQFAVLAASGVTAVTAGVLGTFEDMRSFRRIAARYGVPVQVACHSPDLRRMEEPTITAIHTWSRANPAGAAFYIHTKGASNPSDAHKRQWRRVMMRNVVNEWRLNLTLLSVADIVGCAWQPSADYPHFCGNFWASRCDWLSKLAPPLDYRDGRPDFSWAGWMSWKERCYCETWLGSQAWHHVEDRLGMGVPLWHDAVWRYPAECPGVDYAAPVYLGD